MTYKLCYIEDGKAYFTSNWSKQWGDDWNDTPYEHNADRPYNHYYEKGEEHKIALKELYYEIPKSTTEPCDGYLNSPYSVKDINNKACPWLIIHNYKNNEEEKIFIFAGTTYTKFIRTIEKYGGTVYIKRNNKNENKKC